MLTKDTLTSCGGFSDAYSPCHGLTVALCLWIRREKITMNARVALQLSEPTVTPAPCTADCPSRRTLAIWCLVGRRQVLQLGRPAVRGWYTPGRVSASTSRSTISTVNSRSNRSVQLLGSDRH